MFKKRNRIRLYQTSHNLTFWCIFRRQTLPIYSCSYVLFYACYYGLFQYILIQAITKSWSNHTITTERFSHYRFYHAMRVQKTCFYKLTCVCSFYSPSKSFRVLYEHQNISWFNYQVSCWKYYTRIAHSYFTFSVMTTSCLLILYATSSSSSSEERITIIASW